MRGVVWVERPSARATTGSIIIQACPATRSSISSTISPAPAATFSCTTTASGPAVTPTRRSAAPRAGLRRASAGSASAKGDKVVFWCENRPEWIVAFWGCLLDGVVVVPVDYRSSAEFLARVIADRRGQARSRRSGRAAGRDRRRAPLEAARARLGRHSGRAGLQSCARRPRRGPKPRRNRRVTPHRSDFSLSPPPSPPPPLSPPLPCCASSLEGLPS